MLLQSDLLEPIHGAPDLGCERAQAQVQVRKCVPSVCIREMFQAFQGVSVHRK